MARLTEETGEIASALQRQEGLRPRKEQVNLGDEVGDLLFTLGLRQCERTQAVGLSGGSTEQVRHSRQRGLEKPSNVIVGGITIALRCKELKK